MLFKKHPYTFVGSFDESIIFLFFSESGEFDDGFAYPMRVEFPSIQDEIEPDERWAKFYIPPELKWQFLTFIANLNIILSYRHNKWSPQDIDEQPLATFKESRPKVFWNRDNIEILEDLGIGVAAINNLFARKNEILKRLKISQEEFDNYLPIAKEYIQHLKNKQVEVFNAEEAVATYERFYNLNMSYYPEAFYIYNEQGDLFINKYFESRSKSGVDYLKFLFQERNQYPLVDEFIKAAEVYGIPVSLAVEKYIEYANKYTLPEDAHLKTEAFKLLMEMGLI